MRSSRASSSPAIIITSASTNPPRHAWAKQGRVILYPAIDLKDGHCVRLVRGEMASATVFNTDPAAQARHFAETGFSWLHVVDLDGAFAGVAAIVYTDIGRDGALTGVDAAAIGGVARFAGLPVIASGGVAGIADIAALRRHERDGVAGVICGRALYDGRLDARAALQLVEEDTQGTSAC